MEASIEMGVKGNEKYIKKEEWRIFTRELGDEGWKICI